MPPKLTMSASLTVRRCVSSESPIAQVFEVLLERVHVAFGDRRAAHVFARHRRQHRRRALHRGALQVVLHRAHAAQFFAAAGAARAAVLQQRQRRAVAGGFGRGFGVEDVHAAVLRGDGRHDLRGDLRVLRDERRDQAAAAVRRERDRFVDVVVGHERAHRAEGFDAMHRGLRRRVAREQQRGREERAGLHAPRRAARSRRVHRRARRCLATVRPRAAPRRPAAPSTPARPSSRLRSPGRRSPTFASRSRSLLRQRVDVLARHDRAADRGALLPRLAPSSRARPHSRTGRTLRDRASRRARGSRRSANRPRR